MYQSLFSYNITRPYPFRWLTPVVIIGGIVATILVSFLNVAATGYELYSLSSADPNATLGAHIWFGKWPSFIVSTRASCESATIPLQTRLYTNNTAFPYTLYSVWKLDENTQQQNVLGSLVYNNQPLQSCNITDTISIDINADDRTGGQMALIPVGATLTAEVVCAIDDLQGRTYFKLYGSYDPIPPPSDPSGGFLARNKTTKASLWWGESIMRLYWANLMMEYYNANVNLKDGQDPFNNGVVDLVRNSNTTIATADEVTSIDFFNIWCGFNSPNSTGIMYHNAYCNAMNNTSSLLRWTLMPSIWNSINVLGKATYFSVLADLGRNNDSGPNMLADPILLANLSQNLTVVNQTTTTQFRQWLPAGPAGLEEGSFDPSTKWSLGVSPAVLTTNYICQVPKLKTGGTLFVSVLVADLVLLQTLWMIFKFIVDTFWIGKRLGLKSCEGCASSARELDSLNEDEPLVPR
ncbi:uncharacterized protein PAC_16342 [Phialocephala subalpina]|uniref:Transmembrane protein n=1 Tax=Phialocephala subalpina TaxID=576137 RepID=A0A1L7XN00_9HELO|nr:uncharacterized protein PAC_16342 [Phialocephala subalpina]